MTFYDYLMIALAVIAVVVVLVFTLRTGKFFKTLLWSAVWGLSAMIVLWAFSPLTGFKLEFTPLSIGTGAIFGLPGVICMAVTKMLWGMM